MDNKQAKKRIDELRGYYAHLASFVAVNAFLLMINLVNTPDNLWIIYPLGGWGIGLFIHTFTVFMGGKNWEQRKMEELTGFRQTQDELQRLSERTDTLIAILSDLNWEKVDPELVATRDELNRAHERIVSMQASGEQAGGDELREQIARLEAFVTSPKFDYLDKASRS